MVTSRTKNSQECYLHFTKWLDFNIISTRIKMTRFLFFSMICYLLFFIPFPFISSPFLLSYFVEYYSFPIVSCPPLLLPFSSYPSYFHTVSSFRNIRFWIKFICTALNNIFCNIFIYIFSILLVLLVHYSKIFLSLYVFLSLIAIIYV